MKLNLVAAAAILAAVFPFPTFAAPAEPVLAATAYQVQPIAQRYDASGKEARLAAGSQIWEGEMLVAKPSGQVRLVLADGSVAHLEGGSELVFRPGAGGLDRILGLARGLLRVAAARQGAGRLTVATGSAVAGVKGTQFQVEARDGVTEVRVLEGAVQVDAPGSTATALVKGGQSVLSYPDRVDAVRKLNAKQVRALRLAFKDLVTKKQQEYTKRVREAQGKRSPTPEGKP